MRIKFQKGKQREFIDGVLETTGCPSFRELVNRGVEVRVNALKNYHSERRLLPSQLLEDLCRISGIKKGDLHFETEEENWGQIKGGKS